MENVNSSGERKLNCGDESKCFQLLESILDGEALDGSKELLDQKLAKCQPCFESYHLEQAIRDILKNKCTKQPVPSELADRTRQKIAELRYRTSMSSGKAIIFSAASGSGKTTIVKHLLKTNPALGFSISACTRDKRGREEQNGKDYYFLTPEEFKSKIDQNAF